jgi:hypothetical protein
MVPRVPGQVLFSRIRNGPVELFWGTWALERWQTSWHDPRGILCTAELRSLRSGLERPSVAGMGDWTSGRCSRCHLSSAATAAHAEHGNPDRLIDPVAQ